MKREKATTPEMESVVVEADTVVVEHLTLTHPLVIEYLSRVKAGERCDVIRQAIGIGVLALMEDRVSAFLARTENELGVQLENLKLLYKNREILAGTTRKGMIAEVEYADVLRDFIKAAGFADTLSLTGSSPEDELNKTGDILITVNDSRLSSPKLIAVESKMVGNIVLGTIAKRAVTADGDTVLSQLLEMKCNRRSHEQIIVLDEATAKDAIKDEVGTLRYFDERGFVAVTDRSRYNFEPLRIAYLLARRMVVERALAEQDGSAVKLRIDAINLIIEKFFRNLELLDKIRDSFLAIRKQTFAGLGDLEKMQLAVARDRDAVNKLLSTGNLTDDELFDVLEHAGLCKEWAAREAALKAQVKQLDKTTAARLLPK